MGERGPGRYVYPYPRPMVTVDVVLFCARRVLLIRRGHDPFAGYWALPGGFLDRDEEPMMGAERELAEETGLKGFRLRELGAFGACGRDPRGWSISLAFWCELPDIVPARAGDDAAEAAWISLDELPRLAFDHAEIVRRAAKEAARPWPREPI